MKKRIKDILMILLFVMLFSCVSVNAATEYVEADTVLKYDSNGYVSNLDTLLNRCKMSKKSAKFSDKVYKFNQNITIPDGISFVGSNNTVFQGYNGEYQLNIFDDANGTSNIEIKNIIFDNFTIYANKSSKSSNWTIENNVFVNAKRVDLSVDSGLKPDSNNQNGGENSGYYILISHNSNTLIKSNLFLRDENSLGRGIATYMTSNTQIIDNYMGMLEDLDTAIVSNQTKELGKKLDGIIKSEGNQGYFQTGINGVNGDTNLLIKGNHFSFNTDIFEQTYEDKSYTSLGYHRDHLIYAKGYTNLEVVGNYFKGQNKNQDGGIKFRNGDGLYIHKNILDDVLLLLYIQPGDSKLANVCVTENIFYNKMPCISPALQYPTNSKYVSQSFLVLLYNYVDGGDLRNITIKNNEIFSYGLNNEKMTLNLKASDSIDTFSIYNNNNRLNNPISINVTTNSDITTEIKSNNEYKYTSLNDYSDIDVSKLLVSDEIDVKIQNKKLVSDAEIYIDGIKYENQQLDSSKEYKLTLVKQTEEIIKIDDPDNYGKMIDYTANTNDYAIYTININEDIKLPNEIDLDLALDNEINLANYINNIDIYNISIEGNSNYTLNDNVISVNKTGNYKIVISVGGYAYELKVNTTAPTVDVPTTEVPTTNPTTTPTTNPTTTPTTEVPTSTPTTNVADSTGSGDVTTGCAGSITGFMSVIMLAGAVVMIKRKKDNECR